MNWPCFANRVAGERSDAIEPVSRRWHSGWCNRYALRGAIGHDKSGGEDITGMLGAAAGIGSAGRWAVLDWGIDGGCWLVMRHGSSRSDGRMLYRLMASLMVFGESRWAKNLSV